jgi:F-type H+-transporting ATPase subunit delta
MISRTSARRYARALLDVAVEKQAVETVRDELQEAVALLSSHRELRSILAHPAVSAERKKKIIASLWAGRSSSDLVPRLVSLLAERDRIELLPDIEDLYLELWNAQRGVLAAQATTAQPLAEDEKAGLAEALGRAVGKRVELTTRLEPALLGGVLVRMAGRTYDGTVLGRLKSLRHHLAEEGNVARLEGRGTVSEG